MTKTNNNIEEIEHLYKMNKLDIEKFAECAAQAYKEYPLFKYLTNGSYDHNIIKTIISASIYAMKDQVIGFSNDELANSIALFSPPKYEGTKTLPFLSGGGIKLMFIAPPSTFARLLTYENHSMKLKKKHTNHDSWYLYNVTVKPSVQKQGEASKLLRPMFEYFDKTKQECYLETHDKKNIALYEHYGFDLVETSYIPKTDIKHYSMVRKPNK